MSQPFVANLPHNLSAEEARRRIAGGIDKLNGYIPGGSADVKSSWTGNRMHLSVGAMGQTVTGHIDVEEKNVRLELILPGILGMFSKQIEALVHNKGGQLLEDKSAKKKD